MKASICQIFDEIRNVNLHFSKQMNGIKAKLHKSTTNCEDSPAKGGVLSKLFRRSNTKPVVEIELTLFKKEFLGCDFAVNLHDILDRFASVTNPEV